MLASLGASIIAAHAQESDPGRYDRLKDEFGVANESDATLTNRTISARARVNSASAASIDLVPFRDPWPSGRQRWWDISNATERRYDGFLDGTQEFNYAEDYSDPNRVTKVTLTYDRSPSLPYFVGHIEARGLKPNFCYQIKLLGKPVYGPRGSGPFVARDTAGNILSRPDGGGEDWANEQLGYVGRWWCDTSHATQTNFDDSHYLSSYKDAPLGQQHSIYGYQYLGMFVTDRKGNASHDFTGQASYHVTWAGWQVGIKDVEDALSPFSISGELIRSQPPLFYGYGTNAPMGAVHLFYEYEPNGRPRNNVRLAAGVYHCRLLLTEESFHNNIAEGGYWNGVLATEDYHYDAAGNLIGPDTVAANDVIFTIGGSVAEPSAPRGLTGVYTRTGNSLSWSADDSVSYYRIKRSVQAGGPYVTIAGGMPTRDTTYVDRTAVPNTPYYYVVSAIYAGVESGNSSEISITPPPAKPPSSPINVIATALYSNQIRLSWRDTASTEDGFKIERSSDGRRFVEIKKVGANTHTFVDTGLRPATPYYYAVSAYNAAGMSSVSSPVRAFTRSAPPVAPANLRAMTSMSGGVVLEWIDRSNDETSFSIERWENGVGVPIATVLANRSTYIDSRTIAGRVYQYSVRAYGAGGFSERSNLASVRVPL